jgi:hypothetical protein
MVRFKNRRGKTKGNIGMERQRYMEQLGVDCEDSEDNYLEAMKYILFILTL